jgi:hypothetical protein
VKITRPNMADLSRTFASAGESDSKAPPEVSIDVPPSIMPTMEFCRPLSRSRPTATAPQDESQGQGINISVAAGGPAISAPIITLRRGIWRFTASGSLSVTGAIPAVDNYVILALSGPDTLYGPGLNLVQGAIGTQSMTVDFLVHLPTDEWVVAIELSDPVTALSRNWFRGSFSMCHLL